MHAVQEGSASKSFGLQVAQLAGVPRSVIIRAKQRLAELENQELPSIITASSSKEKNTLSEKTDIQQLSLLDTSHPVISALQDIDINELSPKQALDLLFKLKEEL